MIVVQFETDEQAREIIAQKQAEGYVLREQRIHLDGNSLVFAPKPRELHVSCEISGGDGLDPPGIVNDGIDQVTIAITVQTDDGQVVPLNGVWRIPIMGASGEIEDMVRIRLRDGMATLNYRTDAKPGIYTISEDNFDEVNLNGKSYKIRLQKPVVIKVYRDLS